MNSKVFFTFEKEKMFGVHAGDDPCARSSPLQLQLKNAWLPSS
jgi:hypothetical protein